jgi:transcriptional regulator with XRE-family HTH domain
MRHMTQAEAAQIGGLSPSTWSWLEIGHDGRVTVATLNRAASVVGTELNLFLSSATSTSQPRDAIHLRGQELVLRVADSGDWKGLPEEFIDRDARTSRAVDVLLHRRTHVQPACYALIEIWTWFADVGAAIRDWGRRLEAVDRYAMARMVGDVPVPRISGCWIVRATRRNRQLLREHRNFFRSRFPGSSRAWLDALTDPATPMPGKPAILWMSVAGDRLFPARFGQG